MDTELQRPLSFRLSRRGERNNQHPYATDDGGGFLSSRRLPQDNPIKIMWKQGFIRLVFVAGILWMLVILVGLLFHVFSCQSSFSFFSGLVPFFFLAYVHFGIFVHFSSFGFK